MLKRYFAALTMAVLLGTVHSGVALASTGDVDHPSHDIRRVDLGQRPLFLVDGMDEGKLKDALKQCANGPFYKTDFSIGHRGAPLQFPEHTKESYVAAARQGAGIVECDVTFTKDGHLVCRHAECDLHTTTNVLVTEHAGSCSVPFEPFNESNIDPDTGRPFPATARCCASDLTVEQFKSLKGKMDASDPTAKTPEEFLGGTANWRTDLYTSRGTVLTHKESISLFEKLRVKYTPELKAGDPDRLMEVFGGGTPEKAQQRYAQALINDYKDAEVAPWRVWAQSFDINDVLYWIDRAPRFGKQAVFLDDRYDGQLDVDDPSTFSPTMQDIADMGIKIIAPPQWMLLKVTDDGEIVPSAYATEAKKAGLDIIAWTFERSNLVNGSRTGTDALGNPTATFYYLFDVNPVVQVIKKDSDMYKALDVLAKEVGILGIFSDWPATVTYYANCMGLK